MPGLFITGTDTNVGKTVASAAIMLRYRAQVPSLCFWKPIQTGIEHDDDTRSVRALAQCADAGILDHGIRLREPVSPHLAAQKAGVRIDLRAIQAPNGKSLIVEGAGGVLVPVNERDLMIHLILRLQLPALIVARSTLGTINHTLLTLEALRARSLPIAGVMLIGEPNADNRRAIEQYGKVPVIGEMPLLHPLNSFTLSAWAQTSLDPQDQLLEFLR